MVLRSASAAFSSSRRCGYRATLPRVRFRYVRVPLVSSYQRKTHTSGPALRFSFKRLPCCKRLMLFSSHEHRWLSSWYSPGAVFSLFLVPQPTPTVRVPETAIAFSFPRQEDALEHNQDVPNR